jgi:S1/P1 Nuclease
MISVFILSIFSMELMAWGPTGHRAVGEVAQQFLNKNSKAKVHKILNGQSMAQVSTWADEIKSDPDHYSHTFNWHYTDWKNEDDHHDESASSGKLMKAIQDQLAVLKDKKSSQELKSSSLKFLIHLVGDLHQPLHVGNGIDKGGNNCLISFHGQEMSLHQLWDEGMINFTQLSYSELTQFVKEGRSNQDIDSWSEGSPVQWAKESKELREFIYPQNDKMVHLKSTSQDYCRPSKSGQAVSAPKLGYEYSFKFMPLIEKRIFQAGLRLAALINKTL